METAFSPAVNVSVFLATRAESVICERRGAKWPIATGMDGARLREFASVTTRNGPEMPVRREPVRIRLAMIGEEFRKLNFYFSFSFRYMNFNVEFSEVSARQKENAIAPMAGEVTIARFLLTSSLRNELRNRHRPGI